MLIDVGLFHLFALAMNVTFIHKIVHAIKLLYTFFVDYLVLYTVIYSKQTNVTKTNRFSSMHDPKEVHETGFCLLSFYTSLTLFFHTLLPSKRVVFTLISCNIIGAISLRHHIFECRHDREVTKLLQEEAANKKHF